MHDDWSLPFLQATLCKLLGCVQGDRVCDVCKSTINNLPEVTPPAPGTEAGSDSGNSLFDDMDDRNHPHPLHSAFVADQMPGSADIVFDCIRVRPCAWPHH